MAAVGLVARAGAMLVRPGRTWDEVAAEPADGGALLARYVAPLAAIHAVGGALGALVFGISFAEVSVRPSLVSIAAEALAGYVLTLVSVYVVAWLADALAPAFGGQRDWGQALKLAAYSGTALWVAGAAYLYPNLAMPATLLGALHSLYALLGGLQKLMRPDPERLLTYFIAVLAGILVLVAARALLIARAAELGGPLGLA